MKRKPSVESVVGLPVAMVVNIDEQRFSVARSGIVFLCRSARDAIFAAMSFAVAGTAIEISVPNGSIFITLELEGDSELWSHPANALSSCSEITRSRSQSEAFVHAIELIEASRNEVMA